MTGMIHPGSHLQPQLGAIRGDASAEAADEPETQRPTSEPEEQEFMGREWLMRGSVIVDPQLSLSSPILGVPEQIMVIAKNHLKFVIKGLSIHAHCLFCPAVSSVSSNISHVHHVISLPEAPEGFREYPVCPRQFVHDHSMKKHLKCHDKSSGFFRCNGN